MRARDPEPNGPRGKTLVAAVIPSYGRHADVAALLGDLAAADLRSIDLRVVVVDNASKPPLAEGLCAPGPVIEVIRLDENLGGSGGFNAGIRAALSEPRWRAWGGRPELIWLLDSDARVAKRTLRRLVAALRAHPDLVAVGAAIHDASTREPYEIGGRVSRVLGTYGPMESGRGCPRRLVRCDYLSACCLLVRTEAVERTGLMPDVFLNCDDVEWTVRLRSATGLGLAAVAGARAYHPPGKFVTWARYCQARNAFGPVDALHLGACVRFLRAVVEGVRAVGMHALGRDDLAGLHVAGLRAAAGGERAGRPPRDVFAERPARARAELGETIRGLGAPAGRAPRVFLDPKLELTGAERSTIGAGCIAGSGFGACSSGRGAGLTASRARALAAAAWRFLTGTDAHVAIIGAREDPRLWFRGATVLVVTPTHFWTHRLERWVFIRRSVRSLGAAFWHGARIALGGARSCELPRVHGV